MTGECIMCARVAGEGPLFIADLGTSRAYFNEDQFFPGWCILLLKRHATELWQLAPVERATLMDEVARVAQALAVTFDAVKMNYELLGNQVAHIHWHLVPRRADDPSPRMPAWPVEHEPRRLSAAETAERVARIRAQLGA